MYQQTDTFAHYLTSAALERMKKAARKFPQPNYVTAKVAEETGELVKEAVHLAEHRGSRERLEDEAIDALAMIFRLVMEGDQTIGLGPKQPSTTKERLAFLWYYAGDPNQVFKAANEMLIARGIKNGPPNRKWFERRLGPRDGSRKTEKKLENKERRSDGRK